MSDIAGNSKVGIGDASFVEIFRTFPDNVEFTYSVSEKEGQVSDDAYHETPAHTVFPIAQTIIMGKISTDSFDGGVRFRTVGISPGANILSAQIQFTSANINLDDTCNLQIKGQRDVNPISFNTDADWDARTRTIASVDWDAIPGWGNGQSGANQLTPDISSIIQEIVNLPEWAVGNSLVIFLADNGSTNDADRQARNHSGGASVSPELIVVFSSSESSVEITQARAGDDPLAVADVLDSQYIRNTKLGVVLGDTLEVGEFSSTAGVDVILSDGFFIPESDYVQVRLQLLNNGLNVTDTITDTSTITLEHLTTLPNNDTDSFSVKTMTFSGAVATPNDGDILFTFNKPSYKTNLRISAMVTSPYGINVVEMLDIIPAPAVNLPAIPQDFEQVFDDPDWAEPDFEVEEKAVMVLAEFDLTANVLDPDITYAGGGNRFIFNTGPPESLDFQTPGEVLFNAKRLAEKTITNLFDNTLASIDSVHNPSGFVLSADGLLVSSTLEQNLTSKANTYVATFHNTLIAGGTDSLISLESASFTAINSALDLTVSGWMGIEYLDEGTEIETTTLTIDYFNNVGSTVGTPTTKTLDVDNDLLLQSFVLSETAVPAAATKIKFRFDISSLDGGDSIKFRLLLPQVTQLGQATTDIFGIASRAGDVWKIPQVSNLTPEGGTIAITVIGGGPASVGTLFDTTNPLTGQNGFKLEYDGTNLTFSIDTAGSTVTLVGADTDIPTVATTYSVDWHQVSGARKIWRDGTLIASDNTSYSVPTIVPTSIYLGCKSDGTDQPNVVLQTFNITRRATRGGVTLESLLADNLATNDVVIVT